MKDLYTKKEVGEITLGFVLLFSSFVTGGALGALIAILARR